MLNLITMAAADKYFAVMKKWRLCHERYRISADKLFASLDRVNFAV
jgi:hypothetical protein